MCDILTDGNDKQKKSYSNLMLFLYIAHASIRNIFLRKDTFSETIDAFENLLSVRLFCVDKYCFKNVSL